MKVPRGRFFVVVRISFDLRLGMDLIRALLSARSSGLASLTMMANRPAMWCEECATLRGKAIYSFMR